MIESLFWVCFFAGCVALMIKGLKNGWRLRAVMPLVIIIVTPFMLVIPAVSLGFLPWFVPVVLYTYALCFAASMFMAAVKPK